MRAMRKARCADNAISLLLEDGIVDEMCALLQARNDSYWGKRQLRARR